MPIPSYLLALAVGDLESRRIGPRSQVWSEPSVVDAAAYEFANTDKYLTTGEVRSMLSAREAGARPQRSDVPCIKACGQRASCIASSLTRDAVVAAEEIAGPYVWGIYDLLLLPPSFPYGGMVWQPTALSSHRQ